MKKLLFVGCVMLAVFACKKNCDDTNPLSTCLEDKLETYKASPNAKTIKTQNVDCKTHYWLNTDARFHDGLEYILIENCDTACVFGGFSLPRPCEGVYDWDNWKTIWEK